MEHLFNLGQRTWCDPNLYGRKASRLSHLADHGVRTVGGVVIAAAEHTSHLQRAGLGPAATRQQVRAVRLDTAFMTALRERILGMGDDLAVRSSALTEDREAQTQAGKYTSVLHVTQDTLAEAIVEVWSSSHGDSAAQPVRAAPMAVIVQPMVAADVYGVSSSRDPLTGAAVVYLETGADPTAVTSGGVQSGQYRLPYATEENGDATDDAPWEALREVAALTLQIRDLYGTDYEIEFAAGPELVTVLQARPLIPIADSEDRPRPTPPGTWILDPVHYPRPLTPLFESVFAPAARQGSRRVFSEYGVFMDSIELRTIDGWPYVRAVPLAKRAAPSLPGALIGAIARTHPRLRRRLRASEDAIARDLPTVHLSAWKEQTLPAVEDVIDGIERTALPAMATPELGRLAARLKRHLESVVYYNFATDFAHLIPLARYVDTVAADHQWPIETAMAHVGAGSSAASLYSTSLRALIDCIRDSETALPRLMSEQSTSLTWVTAADARTREAWQRHQRRWGFLLMGYDLDDPTVGEIPEIEYRTVRSGIEHPAPPPATPGTDLERLSSHARSLLARARSTFHVREEGESVKACLLGALRALALELGDRLGAAGQLAQSDLTLYLSFEELLRAVADPGAVDEARLQQRKLARRAAQARIPPAELNGPAARRPDLRWLPEASRHIHRAATLMAQNEILSGTDETGDVLRGRPVAAGIHTGPVCIVGTAADLHRVEAGAVVVAKTASPAWFGGLMRAGALVTESGGLLSHAAIVARELGIPAVLGVHRALEALDHGQIVTVNGATGEVQLRTALK
jgi:phosphoenolpyruvate synthase/pyruvate phosphate dikinase